jgi:hypothetical protein
MTPETWLAPGFDSCRVQSRDRVLFGVVAAGTNTHAIRLFLGAHAGECCYFFQRTGGCWKSSKHTISH